MKLEVHAGARSDSRTDLYASNLGNQTAYDVEVEFEQVRPSSDILIQVLRLHNGTIDADVGNTGIASNKFKWSIPVLPPHTQYLVRVDRYPGTSGTRVLIHEATIRSKSSHESPERMDNNSARVWETWNTGSTVGPARPFYSVLVSADNRHPEPGDTVNFTVSTSQPGESDGSQLYADACVNVWLTTGLTAGAPSFDPSGLTDLAYDTSNNRECGGTGGASGVFKVGGPHPQSAENLNISMILPVTVGSSVTVGDQCLTAEIFATPPTGAGDAFDDPSDNRVVYCLGYPPPEPFDSGEVRTWTIYACKDGVADDMCDTAAEVDVRVLATIEGSDEDRVLDNATALIHIKDVPGRVFDANDDSVTGGTTVSWQTASDEHMDFTGTRSGVQTVLHSGPVTDYGTNWSNFRITYTASGLDGGNPPGDLHVRDNFDGSAYWKLTSANSYSFQDPFDLTFSNTGTAQFLEFPNLGTYVLDTTAFLKHATIDDDSDSETDVFSGMGRTIFHVGPIAELGVSDGGPSGGATADQVAFTVIGVNNRDEVAENGKIVVELPAGTTGLTTIPANTGTFDGTASPPTWTWDIRDLELADRRASKGLPEGEFVTLIVEGASTGDTATANVVYDPYEVCVASDGTTATATTETACTAIAGASWHSGTVFDYNDDNDTATLTARVGGGAPDAPTLHAPAVHTPAVGVSWSEVESLHGVPVKDYQVQWSTNGVSGWTQLETELTLPELFDITIQAGHNRYYRVRAVSEAGVKGPWSAPMSAMPIDTSVPGITISETELTIREGESAQYTVALHARPHANVSVRINGGGVVSPSPGTLTYNTNDFNMPKTVMLTGIQDNDADNEQFDVSHTISSSDAGYRSLTPDPVAVTVLDDDSGVSVTADRASVNEGEDITFTLTRTGNTDSAITVDLFVDQRGSFLTSDQLGTRSVNMGARVTTATVTVETENDTVRESAGSVTVDVEQGTNYFLGTARSATVTVQDDDGPPGQPGTLTAVEGDQQVTLWWDAAPVGDAPVLDYSYRVRRSDRSNWDPDWTTLSGGSTRRSHTVTGLTNGQEYVIQVRARNATGNGAEAEVRVNTRTIPGRPDVTVTARHQSLVVTWDVPDTGGRPTTEYRVQWKSGTESFDATRQATTTTREHTIPNLTNGAEYRVRVQARTDAGWSVWSVERAGTPVVRPATSVSITTNARDGVSEPFRVTFTFTDEDHEGNRFGVEGFDVDDIEVRYSPTVGYVFSMKDFREEVAGFRYSARLEDILAGTLSITVKAGAAQSTEDGQQSTAASHSIRVEVPEPVAPTGTEIWASEMTVGEYTGNARGYINRDLSVWNGTGKIGSLSDGDGTTDDDDAFTYAGTNYTVGEVSFVPAWSSILFSVCPGIEGANSAFDLYLDDQEADHADLTLNFDSDGVYASKFDATIAGVRQTCAEYRWQPRRVDWEEGGTVNVRLVR